MSFYHVKEISQKWFLLDPGGKPVYLRGLNHYGDGTYMPFNLKERYGDVQTWRQSVRDRHIAWGFNYLPPSIGPSEVADNVVTPKPRGTSGLSWPTDIRRTPEWSARHFAELDYPFTAFLEVPLQYMAGKGMMDVFSREFREAVDNKCRAFVAPLKDNPNLIGYHFTQNPPWDHTNRAFDDWIIETVIEGTEGKIAWARLMQRIYGSIERWRQTYGIPIDNFEDIVNLPFPLRGYAAERRAVQDRISFMERICDEWYKVYTETIRKYDPNHLILGDRNTSHLHPLPAFAVHIMRRYIDVLSINVMGPASVIYPIMEQSTRHWDGPIHLADTGAGIYNGSYPKSAYMVRDVDEFDTLYGSLVQTGLEHPQVIGMGWCGYYETPASRSGLVDARNDKPDADKLAAMVKWNRFVEREHSALYNCLT